MARLSRQFWPDLMVIELYPVTVRVVKKELQRPVGSRRRTFQANNAPTRQFDLCRVGIVDQERDLVQTKDQRIDN